MLHLQRRVADANRVGEAFVVGAGSAPVGRTHKPPRRCSKGGYCTSILLSLLGMHTGHSATAQVQCRSSVFLAKFRLVVGIAVLSDRLKTSCSLWPFFSEGSAMFTTARCGHAFFCASDLIAPGFSAPPSVTPFCVHRQPACVKSSRLSPYPFVSLGAIILLYSCFLVIFDATPNTTNSLLRLNAPQNGHGR